MPDSREDACPERRFAVEVVRQLREAGHESVWAGGCVRDQLLGLRPKDYDVATSAEPGEVRRIFGKRRTLPMGVAFGVITVLGDRDSGQIEVATFRKDMEYSDGRRPDGVHYSSAEEDAQRRDFTINGIFYDPLTDEIIDYVGGQDDLQRRIVQAIGRPEDRIAEDKLRMLRAVRFAARLDFAIAGDTLAAIQRFASEIHVVSGERIGAEMRRLLAAPRPVEGVKLLAQSGLMAEIAPALQHMNDAHPHVLVVLGRLIELAPHADFISCLGASLFAAGAEASAINQLADAWRLSNEERSESLRIAETAPRLLRAKQLPWPTVQRLLVVDANQQWRALLSAEAAVTNGQQDASIRTIQERTKMPRDSWDPPVLLDGKDLKQAGCRPGPAFKRILDQVRDAQLDGRVATKADALELAINIQNGSD